MEGDGRELALILSLFPGYPVEEFRVKIVWAHLGCDSLAYLDAINHFEYELAWGCHHGNAFTLSLLGQAQAVLVGARDAAKRTRVAHEIATVLRNFPTTSESDYGY